MLDDYSCVWKGDCHTGILTGVFKGLLSVTHRVELKLEALSWGRTSVHVFPSWMKSLSPGRVSTAPVPNATAQVVAQSLFISTLHDVINWVKLELIEISGAIAAAFLMGSQVN